MKSESLKKEKIPDNLTGEDKFNFSKPTIKLKSEVNIINVHYVKEDEEMRLDLISNLYYGSPDFVDIILKANGISNPFSVKEGMFLRIPDKEASLRYKNKIKKVSNKPRTQFTDPKRMNEEDAQRKKFLEEKSKSKPNGSKENLPPNMLKSDESVKIVKDDKIILGANMRTSNRNRE
jgi:hypothetical protein